MRHADNHFFTAVRTRPLNQFVNQRNQAFTTFQTETLNTGITGTEILLETFSSGESFKDMTPGFGFVFRMGAHGLHSLLEPAFNPRIDNVHVFRADAAAIGLFQTFDNIAQFHGFSAEAQ